MSESRHYQRRINQKLRYARQLLNSDSEAAVEAALWHLSIAYKAWLAEIANDLHHPLQCQDSSSATAMANSTTKHIPAALAECVELESNSASWLSQLLAANGLGHSLINTPPKPQAPNLISLNESPEAVLPSAAESLSLAAQLETMIDRYREAMIEY